MIDTDIRLVPMSREMRDAAVAAIPLTTKGIWHIQRRALIDAYDNAPADPREVIANQRPGYPPLCITQRDADAILRALGWPKEEA